MAGAIGFGAAAVVEDFEHGVDGGGVDENGIAVVFEAGFAFAEGVVDFSGGETGALAVFEVEANFKPLAALAGLYVDNGGGEGHGFEEGENFAAKFDFPSVAAEVRDGAAEEIENLAGADDTLEAVSGGAGDLVGGELVEGVLLGLGVACHVAHVVIGVGDGEVFAFVGLGGHEGEVVVEGVQGEGEGGGAALDGEFELRGGGNDIKEIDTDIGVDADAASQEGDFALNEADDVGAVDGEGAIVDAVVRQGKDIGNRPEVIGGVCPDAVVVDNVDGVVTGGEEGEGGFDIKREGTGFGIDVKLEDRELGLVVDENGVPVGIFEGMVDAQLKQADEVASRHGDAGGEGTAGDILEGEEEGFVLLAEAEYEVLGELLGGDYFLFYDDADQKGNGIGGESIDPVGGKRDGYGSWGGAGAAHRFAFNEGVFIDRGELVGAALLGKRLAFALGVGGAGCDDETECDDV